MENEVQAKIFRLLDIISVEVSANRVETSELRGELRSETSKLRDEMRSGFGRVDRRLGHLETRVENVETELRSFRLEFERRIAPLEAP
jgi:hypothetical protein